MSLRPLVRSLVRSLVRPLVAAAQRIFITLDGVDQSFTLQSAKTYPDDFDLSIDAVLPTGATTVTLFGQAASASNYIKVLSTGFASINIDTSIVSSTVLATKDSKQRRYGVKLVGDDFIFTEDAVTIDTVTDAVAAAKTLTIDVIAQSNSADFFNKKLSDPNLLDLTTPSNSVSWLLNLKTGNTEPAIDGGNDLTYVNIDAAARELFTFNQSGNRWLGDDVTDITVGGMWNDNLDGTYTETSDFSGFLSVGGESGKTYLVELTASNVNDTTFVSESPDTEITNGTKQYPLTATGTPLKIQSRSGSTVGAITVKSSIETA